MTTIKIPRATLLLLCLAGCGDDSATPMDASLSDGSLARDALMSPDTPPSTFSECVADVRIPIEEPFELDRFFQLMDFSNEELGIRLQVAVSPAPLEMIIGLAINYSTRALAIENADGLLCIRDDALLSYDVTQHNDNDTFTAIVTPDEHYRVLMAYDWDTSTFTDTLTIEHPLSGAPSDGPYPLTQAGCAVHDEDGVSDCTYQIRDPY